MAFERKCGQTAIPSSDGNFDIDVGFVPKAMKFTLFPDNATGSQMVNDVRYSTGVYDGTNSYCNQLNDEDGQSPADCFRRTNSGSIIRLNQPGSNTNKQLSIHALNWATVGSEGVDGIHCSIDWDDVTPEGASAYLLAWEAFGGSDVEKAECGVFGTETSTGVKTQNLSDSALTPTVLWAWGAQQDGLNASAEDAQFSYGFSDGVDAYCMSYTSNHDTGASSDVGRGQYDDALFVRQDPASGGASPSTNGKATIDSFNLGNFKYNVTNDFADNYDVIYLVLQGVKCKVTDFLAPDTGETTGTIDITGATFEPAFAEVLSAMHNGTTQGTTNGYLHIGFTDGTNNYSRGATGENDVNPSDTRSYGNDYAFYNKRNHANGDSQGELAFNSWLSNGMRATILENSNSETYVAIMFLGAIDAPEPVDLEINLHGNLKGQLNGGFE